MIFDEVLYLDCDQFDIITRDASRLATGLANDNLLAPVRELVDALSKDDMDSECRVFGESAR